MTWKICLLFHPILLFSLTLGDRLCSFISNKPFFLPTKWSTSCLPYRWGLSGNVGIWRPPHSCRKTRQIHWAPQVRLLWNSSLVYPRWLSGVTCICVFPGKDEGDDKAVLVFRARMQSNRCDHPSKATQNEPLGSTDSACSSSLAANISCTKYPSFFVSAEGDVLCLSQDRAAQCHSARGWVGSFTVSRESNCGAVVWGNGPSCYLTLTASYVCEHLEWLTHSCRRENKDCVESIVKQLG